ncbi:hypothetical protein BB559_001650 [Furculomyces boomerangus]|uniref:Ribosomal protein S2 n=2 Tax=Harpellales TaxID=61421 RepID=A0A2T9Z186_9FUNG|nr:hypothetical protein BB559_001650 [Furculomyces boomerangus]PVZ98897.1 hypothetical protein BB558_005102 [Smittium angustum]
MLTRRIIRLGQIANQSRRFLGNVPVSNDSSVSTESGVDKEILEVEPVKKELSKDEKARISNHLNSLIPSLDQIGGKATRDGKSRMGLDELRISDLVAAGVHLGHSKELWHPMNMNTIFGLRNGIHIINLEHTMAALRRAAGLVKLVAYKGGIILFVGTKESIRNVTLDAAFNCNQYYVIDKWVAGTLTNAGPLLSKQSSYIQEKLDVPEAAELVGTQKEDVGTNKKKSRYQQRMQEQQKKAEMESNAINVFKPDLIVALNPIDLKTMLSESVRSHVPTIGIADTNFDPRKLTFSIPGNDDSVASVGFIANYLSNAALAGKNARKAKMAELVALKRK